MILEICQKRAIARHVNKVIVLMKEHNFVRAPNVIVGVDCKPLIIDYDWSYKIHEAHCPLLLDYTQFHWLTESSAGEEVLSSHDENALIYCMQDTLYLMCEDISLSMFQKIEKGKVTVTSEIDLDISIAALKLL